MSTRAEGPAPGSGAPETPPPGSLAGRVEELLRQLEKGLAPSFAERVRYTFTTGAVAAVLVAVFFTTGGYGAFIASGSPSDGLIATTELDIDLDVNATAVPFTEAIGDPSIPTALAPDDVTDDPTDDLPGDAHADRVATITNSSDIAASLYLQVTTSNDSAVAVTDPAGLAVLAWRCVGGTYSQASAWATPVCSGTETPYDLDAVESGVDGDLPLAPVELESSIAAAETVELRIRVALGHAVGAAAAGEELTLTVRAALQPARAAGAV